MAVEAFECQNCRDIFEKSKRNVIYIKDQFNKDTGRTVWFCPSCTSEFLNWELKNMESRITDGQLRRLRVIYKREYGSDKMIDIKQLIKDQINAITLE